MEKLTFDKVVGFVLAACFALVMGISMWALLVGDYMNAVMNDQAQQTLRIVGFAGALAALTTWWVQGFAAKRGVVMLVPPRAAYAAMILAAALYVTIFGPREAKEVET